MDFYGARYHKYNVTKEICNFTCKNYRMGESFKCKSVIGFEIDGDVIDLNKLVKFRPHDYFCEYESKNSLFQKVFEKSISNKLVSDELVSDKSNKTADPITDLSDLTDQMVIVKDKDWLCKNLEILKLALNDLTSCTVSEADKFKFHSLLESCKLKFKSVLNNFKTLKDRPFNANLNDADGLNDVDGLNDALEECEKLFKKLANNFAYSLSTSSKLAVNQNKQVSSSKINPFNQSIKNGFIKNVTKEDNEVSNSKEISRESIDRFDLAQMSDGSFVVYC